MNKLISTVVSRRPDYLILRRKAYHKIHYVLSEPTEIAVPEKRQTMYYIIVSTRIQPQVIHLVLLIFVVNGVDYAVYYTALKKCTALALSIF